MTHFAWRAALFSCLFVFGFSAGFAHDAHATPQDTFHPSRAALAGCEWKPFESPKLGLGLLVQDCKDPAAHYVFSGRGSWLEMHRPSDPVTFGGPRVLQVLRKPANETIEETIRKRFIASKLKQPGKSGCEVTVFSTMSLGDGKQAFEIKPNATYQAALNKKWAKTDEKPDDFGCGEYGTQEQTTYFEYHPQESKTRYLYVVFGWDADALFDEKSITFLAAKK